MKLRLNKFVLGLTVAVGSLAMVGCGGSDDPVQSLAATPAVAVTPANITAAKAAAAGLIAAPAVTLPALTSKEGVAVAAGTVLKFTAVPAGASSTTISGFTLTSPAGAATGVLEVGSCKLTVTGGVGFAIGTVLTFDPCGVTFNTAGVPANGTTTNISASINFGGVTVPVAGVPVTVTVVNGVAQITSGGVVVTTGTLSTGA